MRILVTERDAGDATAAAEQLARRGHLVQRCHPDATPECVAVRTGGDCPLDRGDIDVMLSVRHGAGELGAREYGVVCALRSGTPLVVATDDAGAAPGWAAEVCSLDAAADVAESVGVGRGPQCHRAVSEAVRRELARGPRAEAGGTVRLADHGTFIDVVVSVHRRPPEPVRRAAEAAARAALRPYHDSWVHTSVHFVEIGEPAAAG